MQKGTIVLVRFPFTDLGSEKLRPAVVLVPENSYGDVCLAFITSREIHRDDVLCIREEDEDFTMTGLKVTSTIRAGKIATLHKRLVAGEMGRLSDIRLREMDVVLRRIFKI